MAVVNDAAANVLVQVLWARKRQLAWVSAQEQQCCILCSFVSAPSPISLPRECSEICSRDLGGNKARGRLRFEETYIWSVGEGSGTPLQYSCLENPMDGGAW